VIESTDVDAWRRFGTETLGMSLGRKSTDDALYLRNYGQLNVRDELLRIPGMGSVILFGAGDYAMRVWLDPSKLAARSITTGEVIAAIREQNAQVAAGTVGGPPSPKGTEFQPAIRPDPDTVIDWR